MDWRGDITHGAIMVNMFVPALFTPPIAADQSRLRVADERHSIRNLSADDFGVNLDAFGNLSGYAWGREHRLDCFYQRHRNRRTLRSGFSEGEYV